MPDLEQLKELKALLDDGVLSQAEFDEQKKAVLAAPTPVKGNQIAPEPAVGTQMMQQPQMMVAPIQAMPAGHPSVRHPPPGVAEGGQYIMVKYSGPETQKAATFCCILGWILVVPTMGAGLCCIIAGALTDCDPKDEKEVYKLGGNYYSLNGTPENLRAPKEGGGHKKR